MGIELDRAEAIRVEAVNTARFYEQMDEAAKKGSAEYVFFNAWKKAKLGAHDDGLMPHWHDYEWCYTSEQGAKAACLTREDVIGLSHIQLAVLKRLDRNKNFMWTIIGLLLYIVSKLN